MITISINVTRIDKSRIKDGKNGKYLDLILIENKNGPDQYGNDGFVKQGCSREEREAGLQLPILGNWKNWNKQAAPAPKAETKADDPATEEDDIPF